MTSLKQFFWFCSGADPLILKRCPTDHNKYVGIGATVFFTGVLAFLAGAYAMFTVFESYLAATVFGLLWGTMIFNLDRYIVGSMKSRGSFWKDLGIAAPRLILALILALVIAKPLELKIFDSEIKAELISMEQEVFKHQEDLVKTRFSSDIEQLRSEIAEHNLELENAKNNWEALSLMAIQEADGTGGSMQRNLGPIYKAKKTEADKAQQLFKEKENTLYPLINNKEIKISSLTENIKDQTDALDRGKLNGFAARLDALQRLTEGSSAIWMANIFIMLLFIAIETAPIFVKLISTRSPYDLILHKHEHLFEMNHYRSTSLLSAAINDEVNYKTSTGNFRTMEAIKAEKELIRHHMIEEVDYLKKGPKRWIDILQGFFPGKSIG